MQTGRDETTGYTCEENFLLGRAQCWIRTKCFYCDCWRGAAPCRLWQPVNYYWPPEQRRAAQRSDWLAALGSGHDLCGHRRFYALHGLDQLRSGGPECGCGGELAGECLPAFRRSSLRNKAQSSRLWRGRMGMRLSTMNGERWRQTPCPRTPGRSHGKCGWL